MHNHARHLVPVALCNSRSLIFAEIKLHQLFDGHGGEGVGFAGGVIAELDFKDSVLPSVNNRPDLAATQPFGRRVFE